VEEEQFTVRTGGLCVLPSCGPVPPCEAPCCPPAVERTPGFLGGGHQPFSCGSPSVKERADVNFKPNSLILVIPITVYKIV